MTFRWPCCITIADVHHLNNGNLFVSLGVFARSAQRKYGVLSHADALQFLVGLAHGVVVILVVSGNDCKQAVDV